MKFGFVVVLFVFMILGTTGQENNKMKSNQTNDSLSGWRQGLHEMVSMLKDSIMPTVNEKTSKLTNIIDSHKKPLGEKLLNMKEKMTEHMKTAGSEILEQSLDMAEVLQNMTKMIKTDVLNLTPPEAVKQ